MITLSRKDAETWVITADTLETEVDAEGLRQLRATIRNAARLPVPDPPTIPPPPPVVVDPTPTTALAILQTQWGTDGILQHLFTGLTPAQVQALVRTYLPGGKP